ncbi:MAG: flagellar motor protein MotB [Acidimicrobiales bacterium]
MKRRRRHEAHGDSADEDRWLLTYSDMITLLLALFVVLFSLSSLNKIKFAEFSSGVRQAFTTKPNPLSRGSKGLLSQQSLVSRPGSNHPLSSPTTITAIPTTTTPTTTTAKAGATAPKPPDTHQLAQVEAAVRAALAQRHLLSYVHLHLDKASLTIELLADTTFFSTNSAKLSSAGTQVVDTVGGVLEHEPNHSVVKGFTDSQRVIGGPWYSNFMLSAARAVTVVERFVNSDNLARNRLRVVGYGPTEPIATNATPTGRAKNRRVDIVVLAEGLT